MCGICGIYNVDGAPVDRGLLEKMNSTMIHRGPDGAGIFIDSHVGLGHRRLSIIDLEGGRQPMGTEDGTIQVVFNGEIYNYPELKEKLESRGYRFKTRSDTETIVHGYREWGDDFVQRLRGMFAIAVWDAPKRKLLLVRDRVGKKPLYYRLEQNRIAFASELKALLADPGLPGEIDPCAVDAYFSFGYVPSPLSILKSVKKLPPAHMAVHDGSRFRMREYWHLDMERDDPVPPEDQVVSELRARFDEAVRMRLLSDVPLGAFLSGGVDSSAVVASMARCMGQDAVKTVAIGFPDKRFDELEHARMVATHCRTDHTELVVTPDTLGVIDRIVWHFDEPFADSSAIPTYYVSQMARRKVTVALSGDGGDEVFAGYIDRYRMNRLEDKIRNVIPAPLRTTLLPVAGRVYPRLDFMPRPFRLKGLLGNLSRSFEDAYFRDMSFYFLPEMKHDLYTADLMHAVRNADASAHLRAHFERNRTRDVTNRVQYVDIKTYLPEDILVKVDRMSMAHSLEVRAPILDHKLMEYVGRLPSRLKLRGDESKYIFKKALAERLPREILHRRKQGFSIPLASWIRGELRDLFEGTLLSSQSRSGHLLNKNYVEALWCRHMSGRENRSQPLWCLLMFELWYRKFLK